LPSFGFLQAQNSTFGTAKKELNKKNTVCAGDDAEGRTTFGDRILRGVEVN
jgi:hypothetical protein